MSARRAAPPVRLDTIVPMPGRTDPRDKLLAAVKAAGAQVRQLDARHADLVRELAEASKARDTARRALHEAELAALNGGASMIEVADVSPDAYDTVRKRARAAGYSGSAQRGPAKGTPRPPRG
jgi:hypothetical protein